MAAATCPFSAPDCSHPAGVHEVQHYGCRECVNPGCGNRVSVMGAVECTPCVVEYLDQRYPMKWEGS